MKSILINGGQGKMGQALARIIQSDASLCLTVAAQHEPNQPLPKQFDCVVDFSTRKGRKRRFIWRGKRRNRF